MKIEKKKIIIIIKKKKKKKKDIRTDQISLGDKNISLDSLEPRNLAQRLSA